VTDEAVVEAFRALLDLDQHAASWALLSYAGTVTAKSAVAMELIDLLARRATDAALLAILRLAGSRLAGVGLHAVRALARMSHPRMNEALLSALLLADQEALDHLLQLLDERRVAGAAEVLLHRFGKARPDLRKPLARAMVRQGITAERCAEASCRAWVLAEEDRFEEAGALGEVAWQPLAESLGPAPAPGERTIRVLVALARVDQQRLYQALRLRLLKAVALAADRPDKASFDEAFAVAAWVLPALAQVFRLGDVAQALAEHVRGERFRLAANVLEAM
jgi:hypothetical protein